MLGDAIVPATAILLSHHAAHFVHLTMAILITFLAAAALAAVPDKFKTVRSVVGLVLAIILLNGVLLASATYRAFLPVNREVIELSRLQREWSAKDGDLVIARSKNVDDPCGWTVLLTKAPVLFCTDAEVMLTPQEIQALASNPVIAYISPNRTLKRMLDITTQTVNANLASAPNPSSLMYQLGYWAEATSLSTDERKEGIHAIQADLIPLLERVENHDVAVNVFFHQFRRVIVIDNQRVHTFAAERLAVFLTLEEQQKSDDVVLLFYAPR